MINLIITPLFAFIGAFVTRLASWFMASFVTGAIKSLVINLTLFTVISGLITTFVLYVNDLVLDALKSMPSTAQLVIAPIAAMLPPSLPVCVGIVVSVYTTGTVYNLAKEVAKAKAAAAERAAGFVKL
jgi:hypothetical protein